MANCSIRLATAAGVLALTATPCLAQPPVGGFAPAGATQPSFISRPTISPYLNLTRRGGSTASNYYNLVRPQNQFYQSLQQIQQDVGANTQDLTTLQQTATGLPPTGHVAGFFTQSAYFMTFGRGQMARPQQPMTTGYGGGRFGATAGQGATGMMGGQTGMMGGQPGMSGMQPGMMGGRPNVGGRTRGY
jgi:hypothetical protein